MFENLEQRLQNLAIESVEMKGEFDDLTVVVCTVWGEQYTMSFNVDENLEQPDQIVISLIRKQIGLFRQKLGERN